MTKEEIDRFLDLRKRLFKAIRIALREDGGKFYEGSFRIEAEFPDYFDDEDCVLQPYYYNIHLDCYIVGPYRHYDWSGKTFDEALTKCEKEISSWLEDKEKE